MREKLEANFVQLRTRLEALLISGRSPLVFLDLDDTLNRGYGTLIEAQVVKAMRELAAAGVVLGLNTGADISWVGERILSETDRHFVFPFMLLATGRQIYAWLESLQAYALLPLSAPSKGQAMHALAAYLDVSQDQFAFIADFPGAGNRQEGIDDSVLREPVGIVIHVGALRLPEELRCSWETTLLLSPPHREQWLGSGYEATAHYLSCLTGALRRAGSVEQAQAVRQELLRRVERKLGAPVIPVSQAGHDLKRDDATQVWTFRHPLLEVPSTQPIRIQVQGQGLVHAGVNVDGCWQRIYDVPLREREGASGCWEASLLDPEVNAFTFIWFDHSRSGQVKWEGRNVHVRRSLPQNPHNSDAQQSGACDPELTRTARGVE
jgi:hypothetical protein